MSPQLLSPSVVLVDVDSEVDPAELADVAAALQIQAIEHFAPCWGRLASVRAATADKPPRDGEWRMELRKTPTVDGALGYHDETDGGIPVLYVFPWLTMQDGVPWSTTASHELLEALADPLLNFCAQAPDGRIWASEVCDAVEADSYSIGTVAVSNFVTPQYFSPPKQLAGVRLDYLGLVTEPYQIRPGGYGQVYTDGAWGQVGSMRPYRQWLDDRDLSRGKRRAA